MIDRLYGTIEKRYVVAWALNKAKNQTDYLRVDKPRILSTIGPELERHIGEFDQHFGKGKWELVIAEIDKETRKHLEKEIVRLGRPEVALHKVKDIIDILKEESFNVIDIDLCGVAPLLLNKEIHPVIKNIKNSLIGGEGVVLINFQPRRLEFDGLKSASAGILFGYTLFKGFDTIAGWDFKRYPCSGRRAPMMNQHVFLFPADDRPSVAEMPLLEKIGIRPADLLSDPILMYRDFEKHNSLTNGI